MDLSAIHFKTEKIPYKPEPNAAEPLVKVVDNNVLLNYYTSEKVGLVGSMLFKECLMYRVGSPNDEGFFVSHSPTVVGGEHGIINTSIYSRGNFPYLEFNNLYKVDGFDWKKYLFIGGKTIILDHDYLKKEGYNHYVFFMKDGTFECIAKDYKVRE